MATRPDNDHRTATSGIPRNRSSLTRAAIKPGINCPEVMRRLTFSPRRYDEPGGSGGVTVEPSVSQPASNAIAMTPNTLPNVRWPHDRLCTVMGRGLAVRAPCSVDGNGYRALNRPIPGARRDDARGPSADAGDDSCGTHRRHIDVRGRPLHAGT